MTIVKFLIFNIIIVLFTGCSFNNIVTKPEISKATFQKIKFEDIKGFDKDNLNTALDVFKKDCKARRVNKYLKNICKKSYKYTDGNDFFINNFTPYRLLNKDMSDTGLITGYYEPILNGSFKKTEKYKYPIYNVPKDLIRINLTSIYPELSKYTLRGKLVGKTIVPYESRKDINENDSKFEPLLYLDNKIDMFFLEIQGSGKVKLENGKTIYVGYAGQNGRKYYAIGKKLIENGDILKKDMSLQAIKIWCDNNPTKVDKLFNLNNSKIFFHISKKSATGSLGVQLIGKRNIAVDRSYIPLGFPVFLNTTNPISKQDINTLMISADTGGAIKGDIRADYFWGSGKEAKLSAGKMAQKGILTILIPKIN